MNKRFPETLAASLAPMIIEYVEGGLESNQDWRTGLAEIIAARVNRIAALSPAVSPPSQPPLHQAPSERASPSLEGGVSEIRRTLAFFASCIKSGEDWSEHCQLAYEAALRELPLVSGSPPEGSRQPSAQQAGLRTSGAAEGRVSAHPFAEMFARIIEPGAWAKFDAIEQNNQRLSAPQQNAYLVAESLKSAEEIIAAFSALPSPLLVTFPATPTPEETDAAGAGCSETLHQAPSPPRGSEEAGEDLITTNPILLAHTVRGLLERTTGVTIASKQAGLREFGSQLIAIMAPPAPNSRGRVAKLEEGLKRIAGSGGLFAEPASGQHAREIARRALTLREGGGSGTSAEPEQVDGSKRRHEGGAA